MNNFHYYNLILSERLILGFFVHLAPEGLSTKFEDIRVLAFF